MTISLLPLFNWTFLIGSSCEENSFATCIRLLHFLAFTRNLNKIFLKSLSTGIKLLSFRSWGYVPKIYYRNPFLRELNQDRSWPSC